ncbi:MAG: tetratricopeptide repeat-containing diguanylate cyclase, partial [Clostridium sp.]
EKSLKYSTHLNHKIRNLLYISTLYKLEENFDESFRYIDMALELALQSDDKDLINSCMINLGENYYIQKNYAKTIKVYEKILKSVHNKSNRNLVDVYGYLAECYGKKGFYTEYTYYRDEYIKLSKEMNSIKDLEWIYAVSAEIEIENGNINLAREYFNQAKYLLDDKTIMYLNSDLYLDFINAKIDYYSSNDYKVAMQNYINILNTLTERGYKSDLKNLVISEILKISYKSKDYSKFMEYLVNYKKIESIQNAQNETDALLIEYNAKIKGKELYASNVKVIILVLIILIIIYLLINTKRKNIKINELNTKLRELNKIDPLTNIYNRGHLDHILVNSYTESRNIVLVMIDIDYFKQYNDNYGHVEGDKIIVQLGKLLKDVFYDDFVFRYGGEEFSILSYRSKEEIISTIKLLFTELYNKNIKHEYSSISDRLTVSIGVASAKVESKENVSQLLKDADHKLYESKENGRNTYTI